MQGANASIIRPKVRREGNDQVEHIRTSPYIHIDPPRPNRQLKTYKVGDIVDIVGNSAQQKGLPYKYYHGKTGVVFNITKSAVGVSMQKIVGNRYIEKRLHVRVEHVRHSRCRDGIQTLWKRSADCVDFLRRVKENAEKRRQAKETGATVHLKRQPVMPREARLVKPSEEGVETLHPIPYDTRI